MRAPVKGEGAAAISTCSVTIDYSPLTLSWSDDPHSVRCPALSASPNGLPPWAETLSTAERTLAHWTERALPSSVRCPLTGLWLVVVSDDAVTVHVATTSPSSWRSPRISG